MQKVRKFTSLARKASGKLYTKTPPKAKHVAKRAVHHSKKVGKKSLAISSQIHHWNKKNVVPRAKSLAIRAGRYSHKFIYLPSKRLSKKLGKLAVATSLFIHHHIATRPHQHFSKKWTWYDKWHNHEHHQHVHFGIAGATFAVAFVISLINYGKVLALPDLTDTWDFSNASNFVLSSELETSGSSARMKAQNYASDANTMALYHMDETSGSTASDSSSNANNGTVANGTFGAGNLNNALGFNGSTSSLSVPDSASLSLSQSNTIEAWTKLSNNFTASSSAQRQGIVDKGDYQLYYNNETGKVTYELADQNANSWSLAGGNSVNDSWTSNGVRSVNSQIKMGSDIYVGIGADIGDAEVWKWDGTTWTMIGGGASSINGSWASNTYEGVYSIATDGTNIYAGLGTGAGDAEVWRWNGSSWSKIGGDSTNDGWTTNYEVVYTLDHFGGDLYAGLGSSANDAEVWRWDGTQWDKIGGDNLNGGWNTNYEAVTGLTNDGTNLYAGLGASAGDSEVYMWNGSSWSKIGGDSLNGSWDTTIETVRSLKHFGGNLYAGLGDTAGDADVYMYNGSSWSKIGGDTLNGSWASSTYEQVSGFAWDGTNLYAGLGTGNGDGEVYRYNGTSWSKIGGDGASGSWSTNQGDIVNTLLFDSGKLYIGTYDAAGEGLFYDWDGSSWSQIGGLYVNKSWGFYGHAAVNVMQSQGGYLYAGLGNVAGMANVFRFNGSNWELIGGQGVNGSWAPNTYEQVMSMASYGGSLYVGLGISANDAEVWRWDGTTWSKVGGDSLNDGWTVNYEEVDSMASYGGYLYAGLGSGSGDAEVWRYDGTQWDKIGGDGASGSWTAHYNIYSLAVYEGKVVAGLGRAAGEGEVWQWDGSSWSQIGGDGFGGSWGATIESVESLMPYNGKLYAGLGAGTGDATLWEYDGTNWNKIGGDDVNGSWTAGTFEKVKTVVVYNGDLYVGLGNSTGDGEVWRLSGETWTKIGGTGINGGWSSGVEEIESFSPYKGKLYAGTGLSGNVDALVWSWGNNAFLESAQSSFDTNWHHIAGTYDGTTMRLYIDGALNSQTNASLAMPDSGRSLLVGTTYGGREYGKSTGTFDGQIDELRISNIARSSFTSLPYSATAQTATLKDAVRKTGVWHWDTFSSNETPNGGTINYRLSDDDGATWKYWNGSVWATSGSPSQANTVAIINANISTFPVTFAGIKWQAVMQGNGSQRVTLNSITLESTSDTNSPSMGASTITAKKTAGGANLASNAWTNGGSPYFSWTAGTDADSGVKGYCAYLGTDNSADPVSTKGLLGTSPVGTGGNCQFIVAGAELDLASPGYLQTQLSTSNSPYYLTIKAIDNAGNVSNDSTQFHFRYDNTPPTNPSFISAPSGFVSSKTVTMTWATAGGGAPDDANSGLVGLQYRIGSGGTWYGDVHNGSGDTSDLLANDGSYTTQDPPDFANLNEGVNTVYFRTWDAAGNVTSSYVTAAVKINTNGSPSEPQNLIATPSTNTTNSFAFSWSPPATFVGDVNNLTYCYTVNALPNASNCTFTPAGVTSLGSSSYATQPGVNTLYLVARDESNNINYASYSSVNFTANTSAPGMPLNTDIVDVSIKATSNWRLAITWDQPTAVGSGVAGYRIYRSTDNITYNYVGFSSSTTYIDAGLSQIRYYYNIKACDNTNNCGASSASVNSIPTGKFTSPATLVSEPTVSNVTTKRATINWSTDRSSDSKIAIGTSSGHYSSAEIANSNQVSAHQINLDNLAAGTTYYFVAKWTDEDGNTGTSQEYTFRTAPPPTLKEINVSGITLSSATLRFTSRDASKVAVYYGQSESFGGVKTINTSSAESTYSVELPGLSDGTKYFYKLVSYDSEGNTYDGSIASFTTPQRPKITNLTFQPVSGVPTSTQKITWLTNVPSNSTITYGKVGTAGADVQDSKIVTEHEIIVSDLEDNSEYFLIAQSRDADGNLATSDRQVFKTALDTRPPKISNINVEPSIRGTGAESRGQVVVSWRTDEPTTSQVAYAEGSGATVFNSKTAEDSTLSFEHIVIVSDLPTSKVYSVQPVSKDKSGNTGTGTPQSAIIGKASDSVLTIILNALQKVFGF